jgi:hypothetical protein
VGGGEVPVRLNWNSNWNSELLEPRLQGAPCLLFGPVVGQATTAHVAPLLAGVAHKARGVPSIF